jgi:DNA-binding SARP family transcriptional activator
VAKANLALFGRARARSEDGDVELEKKAAACIALLAWEGPTARARIGDLLWPNAGSDAQRANLRQLARRLKLALGRDVVSSGDPLTLDLGVDVDLRQFQSWCASNDWRNVALVRGPLLAGMSFDDCPELEEWLGLIRTRVNWTTAHALAAESARVEKSSGPRDALPHVLRWLELDPTSEDAYRRLMRFHYALGERGAALAAYDTCRTVLRRTLDV